MNDLITIDHVYKLAGTKKPYLKKLNSFITTNYQIQGTIKKDKQGFTVFYKKSGKPLCYVSVTNNSTTATVVIRVSLSDTVTKSTLSPNIKTLYINAKQFYDGKWLQIPLDSIKNVFDVESLILIKKKPVEKKKQLTN